MKTHDCKQNSPEWLALRLGKVTASEIDSLISPEGKTRTGLGPQSYLYRKLAEKILGWAPPEVFSFAMAQGSVIEMEAVPWFAFAHNVNVTRVGFCTSEDEKIGFSPDGLIGDEGGIEVKSPTAPVHLQYLLENAVPKDYVMQVQFSLYVSGRKWWKFISYSRQLPALVVHVEPDAKIQAAIGEALDAFFEKFDAKLAQVAQMKATYEEPLKAAYEEKIRNWEKTGVIP